MSRESDIESDESDSIGAIESSFDFENIARASTFPFFCFPPIRFRVKYKRNNRDEPGFHKLML